MTRKFLRICNSSVSFRVIVLMIGLGGFAFGGEFARNMQIKLRLRILLQAIAILLIFSFIFLEVVSLIKLNKIYTKTGDGGDTALGNGERVLKDSLRQQKR